MIKKIGERSLQEDKSKSCKLRKDKLVDKILKLRRSFPGNKNEGGGSIGRS